MHVRKKGIALGGAIVLSTIVIIVVAQSRPAQSAYHRWRLAAAIENLETAGAGRPTVGQELAAMLWRRPDAGEYLRAWQRHEDALVKLQFLSRREFALSNSPSHNTEPQRVYDEAARIFPTSRLWSVATSSCSKNAIVVTAPAADMPEWERLIGRLHHTRLASRKAGFFRGPLRSASW